MKKIENHSAELVFDAAELLSRVENDQELMRDLLLVFKADFPRHLAALREAVQSRDGNRIAATAHTLKGMLFNLSAGHAAAAAARLEQLGHKGEVSGLDEALACFDSDAKNLLLELDACMTEVPR